MHDTCGATYLEEQQHHVRDEASGTRCERGSDAGTSDDGCTHERFKPVSLQPVSLARIVHHGALLQEASSRERLPLGTWTAVALQHGATRPVLKWLNALFEFLLDPPEALRRQDSTSFSTILTISLQNLHSRKEFLGPCICKTGSDR